MKVTQVDKYARNERAWRDFAQFKYFASTALFTNGNPILVFAAATLGHHALEMYLKAALICEGLTVFDPKKIKGVSPALGLKASDCAWGHGLVKLAEKFAARRPDFDLKEVMSIAGYWTHKMPMTVKQGFALFDPFFSELRYPQELKDLEGVGEHEKIVLDELVGRLQSFLSKIP